MQTLLFLVLALPAVTAVLLMLFRSSLSTGNARWTALIGALVTFLFSVFLLSGYYSHTVKADELELERLVTTQSADSLIRPRVEYIRPWLESADMQLQMYFGLDGISVAMIALTGLLTVSAILISWEAIRDRAPEFYAALLLLETGLVGVFCAFDLVLFYVFFEMTLIPLFFLIAVWGGKQRRWAAVKFFLYTLAGSLVTLSGLIYLVQYASAGGLTSPTSLPALSAWLSQHPLPTELQATLFLVVSAGFLIKVPVFPFHTWLPLAHVEAPTAGSVVLAGVLLKLGSYGFLRLCLPMFPDACLQVGLPLIGLLSVIGVIYGSLCALAQTDIKKLVAYSSVAHLGFCMLGLFALNQEGLTGSVLQMINHGLSTGALFIIVGMIYERYHTREMSDLSGLAHALPRTAVAMVFISMASIGLPGLNGFVGEFLSLAGMFRANPLYSALGTTGVILGAWYLLNAVRLVFFGELRVPAPHAGDAPVRDMNGREFVALAPLAVLCLWIGVRPGPLVELIQPDLNPIVRSINDAAENRSNADGSELQADPEAEPTVATLN